MVELSVAIARVAMQRSLRQQGKPPLSVSGNSLISQLETERLLFDGANWPIEPGRGDNHSRQGWTERRRVRVIRMKQADLPGSDDETSDKSAGSEDS